MDGQLLMICQDIKIEKKTMYTRFEEKSALNKFAIKNHSQDRNISIVAVYFDIFVTLDSFEILAKVIYSI